MGHGGGVSCPPSSVSTWSCPGSVAGCLPAHMEQGELLQRAVALSWGAPACTHAAGKGGTSTGHGGLQGRVCKAHSAPGESCALSPAKGRGFGCAAPSKACGTAFSGPSSWSWSGAGLGGPRHQEPCGEQEVSGRAGQEEQEHGPALSRQGTGMGQEAVGFTARGCFGLLPWATCHCWAGIVQGRRGFRRCSCNGTHRQPPCPLAIAEQRAALLHWDTEAAAPRWPRSERVCTQVEELVCRDSQDVGPWGSPGQGQRLGTLRDTVQPVGARACVQPGGPSTGTNTGTSAREQAEQLPGWEHSGTERRP